MSGAILRDSLRRVVSDCFFVVIVLLLLGGLLAAVSIFKASSRHVEIGDLAALLKKEVKST